MLKKNIKRKLGVNNIFYHSYTKTIETTITTPNLNIKSNIFEQPSTEYSDKLESLKINKKKFRNKLEECRHGSEKSVKVDMSFKFPHSDKGRPRY